MARIADSEIERLKAEVSLVRLIESGGVKLARRGKDELRGAARSMRTIRRRCR